jgi:hypothetical protein
MAEQVREPEELEPRCPQCRATLKGSVYQCRACGYELTPEEIGEAGRDQVIAYFERERRRTHVPPFEIRYWYERPADVDLRTSASHWVVIGYAGSREFAALIAEALHGQRGWKMEVWCLKPLKKRLGPRQLMDRIPDPKSVVPCTCDFCSGRK